MTTIDQVDDDNRGSFAIFRICSEDPRFGWKDYTDEQLKVGGTREHAYRERQVLEHLNKVPEIKSYIAHLEEASSLSANHYMGPNALGSWGRSSSSTALSMRLRRVNGPTLLDFLNTEKTQNGGLTTEVALKLSCKLVEGLAVLHDKCGISHGDLKLDNVMIEKFGSNYNAVLIDWGAACWGKHTEKCKTIQGNVQTCSPQLLEADGDSTARYNTIKNDCFALGMLLTYIWTNVGTSVKAQGGMTYEYDLYAQSPDVTMEQLLSMQMGVIKQYEKGSYPPFFNKIPSMMRDLILALLKYDEKQRADAMDIFDEMHENPEFKKGGVTYSCKKYLMSMKRMESIEEMSRVVDDKGRDVPMRYPKDVTRMHYDWRYNSSDGTTASGSAFSSNEFVPQNEAKAKAALKNKQAAAKTAAKLKSSSSSSSSSSEASDKETKKPVKKAASKKAMKSAASKKAMKNAAKK